jgi:hypothetical protein
MRALLLHHPFLETLVRRGQDAVESRRTRCAAAKILRGQMHKRCGYHHLQRQCVCFVALTRLQPGWFLVGGGIGDCQHGFCTHRRGDVVRKVENQLMRRVRPWRGALLLLIVAWGVYLSVLHPWLMNWGATPDEVKMSLPGDELANGPYFTRAISIDAPPSVVWRWIVQMGQDRAGFYSNSWLENLTGCDIHNADTIHPEWQHRALGDRVPLARAGLADLGGRLAHIGHVQILALDRDRLIANIPGRFVLEPVGVFGTRLMFREPVDSQGPAVTRWLVWDPMHFVMVQRMLRGIKERAEGRPLVPTGVMIAARLGWAFAGLCLIGLFVSRRRRCRWLSIPVALVLPSLLATGDWNAALAGFLAVGTTLIGFLAFGRRWWPTFLLIAAGVLLVLLLSPDAFAAFGLLFAAALTLLFVALSRISGEVSAVLASGGCLSARTMVH